MRSTRQKRPKPWQQWPGRVDSAYSSRTIPESLPPAGVGACAVIDLDRFRFAVAAHLGESLTPEVAAAIEAALRTDVDCTIDGNQFARHYFGDYVIAVERLADVLADLHPLHEAHWLETERHRHGLPLAVDYEQMLRRERSGSLLQHIVRDREDGSIAGHLRMYLGTSLHSGTRFAEEGTLYVAPAHRSGSIGMHLLRFNEQVLRALGVLEVRANSKHITMADVLMKSMLFTPVATQFVKFLEPLEAPDVQ